MPILVRAVFCFCFCFCLFLFFVFVFVLVRYRLAYRSSDAINFTRTFCMMNTNFGGKIAHVTACNEVKLNHSVYGFTVSVHCKKSGVKTNTGWC